MYHCELTTGTDGVCELITFLNYTALITDLFVTRLVRQNETDHPFTYKYGWRRIEMCR